MGTGIPPCTVLEYSGLEIGTRPEPPLGSGVDLLPVKDPYTKGRSFKP